MRVPHYEYLKDSTFLKEIDELKNKEQFVKIVVLTWKEENPIDEIQGKVISGSIGLDGSSSVRRTGNLSMIVDDTTYDILNVNNLISINKKIEIEIGFTNITNKYKQYDVIWFPLGVYVIKNPSVSHSASGITISLSLSDKMCLLNGDIGGVIPAAATFDTMDIYDSEGNITSEKVPIYLIIQRLVYEYGGEDLNRIIINDIDTIVKQTMQWIGDGNIYLVNNNGSYEYITTKPTESETVKIIRTFSYGQDIGYIYSDFYYPNDLTASPGDSVVTILDKIKEALGNYEYYYDIYGNFVFQEIKNYLNTSQATSDLNNDLTTEDYLLNRSKGKSIYQFTNGDLIVSYNNSPNYINIKNDFIVWGLRDSEGSTGVLRYHLVIDTKPQVGNKYIIIPYDDNGITRAKVIQNLIKINNKDELPDEGSANSYNYFVLNNKIYQYSDNYNSYIVLYSYGQEIVNYPIDFPIVVQTHDWREELYYQAIISIANGTSTSHIDDEMSSEWPKIFCVAGAPVQSAEGSVEIDNETGLPVYQGEYISSDRSAINYYIDYIDSNAKISDISVQNIGRRTQAVEDTSINCVFAPETPDFILIETGQDDTDDIRDDCIERGQNYAQVSSEVYSNIAIGGGTNSAYDYIRSLLYTSTSYNESISITTIPIYYLEPNTRITVENKDASINGDYMIKTISLPLDVSGTMTINANRALERI